MGEGFGTRHGPVKWDDVKGENEDEGRVLAYKGGEKRVQKGRRELEREGKTSGLTLSGEGLGSKGD